MRGTLDSASCAIHIARFIPAYAGNTSKAMIGEPSGQVHPRVCGEHVSNSVEYTIFSGSSPRMRGTRRNRRSRGAPRRFIPAYAGNTSLGGSPVPRSPVHPRVCGEHAPVAWTRPATHGSSPRMRGTLHVSLSVDPVDRFIPAYAGNTRPSRRRGRATSVHPRVCGEHSASAASAAHDRGSSPRMRGTPIRRNSMPRHRRFIPAYAGNTEVLLFQFSHCPVHPRVCGEHNAPDALRFAYSGSSPRMRGTHRSRQEFIHQARFIPAYAGNTSNVQSRTRRLSVHPRVCGEHRWVRKGFRHADGSSPRMRGTHLLDVIEIEHFFNARKCTEKFEWIRTETESQFSGFKGAN